MIDHALVMLAVGLLILLMLAHISNSHMRDEISRRKRKRVSPAGESELQ